MKKMTTLGTAALLSVAAMGAQAQVQTLNDSALSEISGQGGISLYTGLVQGTKPFAKAAVIDAAVGAGAIIGGSTIYGLTWFPSAITATVATPLVGFAAGAAIATVGVAALAATPFVATAALIQGRVEHGPNGTGIRHAAGALVAGPAIAAGAFIAAPVVAAAGVAAMPGVFIATTAARHAVSTAVLVGVPAAVVVTGASFVHHSAHIAGRVAYNGIQTVSAHLSH